VIVAVEEDGRATSWCCTVVAQTRIGSNGPKNRP
jgi:hypothetical protein